MATFVSDSDFLEVTFTIEPSLKEHVAQRAEVLGVGKSVCKYFLKGTCMKGDNCAFRHVKGEKSVVCKHWLRGLCKKNDYCEFLHEYDLSRMPPCHFFVSFGKCSNEECPFLHLKPEDRIKDCPWYDRGFCKHGPNCRHRHVRKSACPDYLAGFCYRGPNCELGHPKFELLDEHGNPVERSRTTTCNRCGQVGHIASQCTTEINSVTVIAPLPSDKKRLGLREVTDVTCFKCGERGHYANVCPNRRRPPPAGGYSLPGVSYLNPRGSGRPPGPPGAFGGPPQAPGGFPQQIAAMEE